ncbi:MAG: hypothetical protein RL637_653 [Pseudomonadota bacterium]|jgi:Ca2+-binding RTX toxin-like protein
MAYLEIPGVGFIANQLIGADVKEKLSEQVISGLEKWDAGDEIGATADFSQVVAVTMAGVVATAIMASDKAAISGLTPVFQSLASNKGFAANILEKIGYQFSATSWLGYNLNPVQVQKIGNWGVSTAVGYSSSWWVDKIIDTINDLHLGVKLYDSLHTNSDNPLALELDSSVIENVKQQVTSAKSTSSPIILDLNNNGIETTGVKQGAYFDHANDGFAEQTGWVGANDGLLVRDINGNGKIDNGSELFGSETLLENGTKAANGFEALKALDGNGDHQINADDVAFTSLKIWIDSNGDGFSRAGELVSLTEAEITAISTAYANSDVVDAQGNAHRQLGTYTRADGSQAAAEDVWFAVDRTYSVATSWITIPDEMAGLPNLTGYGVVRDLQQALALDDGGSLNQLILNYKNETDEGQRHSLVNRIIYDWTDADSISPQSRGSYVDARQLVALEHFLGDSFYQTGWGANPGVTAGKKIAAAFTELSNSMTAQLEAQTQFSDLYQHVRWSWDDSSQTLQMDLTGVIAALQTQLNADSVSGLSLLDSFARNLKALGWANPAVWQSLTNGLVAIQPNALEILQLAQLNTLTGSAENNRLDGTVADERLLGFGGDDVLNGQAGDDVLESGTGQDTIEAGAGNDVLMGGAGNDVLDGNAGSDIYSFQQGFGNDHIHQYDSATDAIDVVNFVDLMPTQISQVIRQGNDLSLITTNGDELTVDGYFETAARRVDYFDFTDGEQWDLSSIKAHVDTLGTTGDDSLYGYTSGDNRIFGLEGNDDLHGNSGNDYLKGDDGNDLLYGQSGDDILNGCCGNDTLNGGMGNDTLVGGMGNDILTSGSGNDFFQLTSLDKDSISDFSVIDDTIQLENDVFLQLTTIGQLNSSYFKIGTAASDNNDFIIYNSVTGILFYDADGNNSGAAIQIAGLTPNLALTITDFIVI